MLGGRIDLDALLHVQFAEKGRSTETSAILVHFREKASPWSGSLSVVAPSTTFTQIDGAPVFLAALQVDRH